MQGDFTHVNFLSIEKYLILDIFHLQEGRRNKQYYYVSPLWPIRDDIL